VLKKVNIGTSEAGSRGTGSHTEEAKRLNWRIETNMTQTREKREQL
jgi:hypothetical protein